MNDVKTVLDETSFWYSKASQRRVTEFELRTLTTSSVSVMEEIIREIQHPETARVPVSSDIHH